MQNFYLKFILDFDFMTHDITKKPLICEINTRPSGSIVDSENQGKKIFTKFVKIYLKDFIFGMEIMITTLVIC